jgi:hypothetical protein
MEKSKQKNVPCYKRPMFWMVAVAVVAAASVAAGLLARPKESVKYQSANENVSSIGNVNSIIYENTQYGFRFTLPASWKGYTIVTSRWEGTSIQSGNTVETGPIISIRHPLWTAQNPRQDIPIMVFTLAQWSALQREDFHIGAAPIGPSELGRNAKYVFALPARYNFAFLPGYEEVEKILDGKPLQPIEENK